MTMTVLAAVAQLERELIRERIKTALASKKLAAQKTNSEWKCGCPKRVKPEIETKIIQLHKKGKSIREIERTLNKAVGKPSIARVIAMHFGRRGY